MKALRQALAAALLVLGAAAASLEKAVAHPGVGIVMDAHGNVYYTDLNHVWRLTPQGKRSIVVRDVHTHELCLDEQGNLYGEHLWYEGEATDKWGHYVWRLQPDGRLDKILGPREGFPNDYSFIRDRSGTMYWVDRERREIRKRSPDGTLGVVARHPFRHFGWMTATPQGTLYLTDDADLLKIDREGSVSRVASGLRESSWAQFQVGERHNLMGLWSDSEGNVYVAVWGGRLVKKVAPDGTVSVVARSGFGWGPTGGLVAPNGDLWILECSIANAVRVRRISPDGGDRTW